jgi:hypothetical protein
VPDRQPFLSPDGTPVERLDVSQRMLGPADGFNAGRLILAMLDEDFAEMDKILTEFPALPLLTGLTGLFIAFGDVAADGDMAKFRKLIDHIALSPNLDQAGTADAYRMRVAP